MKNSMKNSEENSEIKFCEKCGGACDASQCIKVTVCDKEVEYFLCMEHSVQLMCIMGKVLEDYLPREDMEYKGVMH